MQKIGRVLFKSIELSSWSSVAIVLLRCDSMMAEEDRTLGCNNVILHEIYSIGGAYQPPGYIICDVYGTLKSRPGARACVWKGVRGAFDKRGIAFYQLNLAFISAALQERLLRHFAFWRIDLCIKTYHPSNECYWRLKQDCVYNVHGGECYGY